MSGDPKPAAGVDAFPDVPAFNDAMRRGIEACNGFVYLGGDMDAQIRFVKWLRTHPDDAALLLAAYDAAGGVSS